MALLLRVARVARTLGEQAARHQPQKPGPFDGSSGRHPKFARQVIMHISDHDHRQALQPSERARHPVRAAEAQRALAHHLPADRRDLSGDRRAGRLAQPVARTAHDAVAGLDPQRHVGPRASGAHLRAAHLGRPPADRDRACACSSTACSRSATSPTRSAARSRRRSRIKREKSVEQVLTDAGEMISGLSHCAGVVLADKQVSRLKHIEFVPLEPGKALVVLVGDDQQRREPRHRPARGAAAVQPDRGRQLSQRAHPRPDARPRRARRSSAS